MRVNKRFVYRVKVFGVGQVARAVESVLQHLGIEAATAGFSITEYIADGSSVGRNITFSDVETICEPARQNLNVYWAQADRMLFFMFRSLGQSFFCVDAESTEPSMIAELQRSLEQVLSVVEATAEELKDVTEGGDGEALEPLLKRIEALEQIVLAPTSRLRCFLSYRFTPANEIPALRINQFLTLLNVEVLSGSTYEPRQVSEKVLSKLKQPLDFIVLLITAEGESMWTRDEIGAALHRGIALVPLVEVGATLQPGLLADIEYVEFAPGHVGDGFLKLLEAVRFIREQKSGREPLKDEAANKSVEPTPTR
jgi:hypothetical protein